MVASLVVYRFPLAPYRLCTYRFTTVRPCAADGDLRHRSGGHDQLLPPGIVGLSRNDKKDDCTPGPFVLVACFLEPWTDGLGGPKWKRYFRGPHTGRDLTGY